jgi:membrane protein implicated in regulation of membrane protease activity
MPWWGWIMLGTVLLGAELFVIPTDFFLVFLGVAAFAVGGIGFVGVELPPWAQWATFAVLAVFSLVFFRGWLRARWPKATRVDDTLVGEIAVAREPLAAGASGQIELRGSTWSARNASDVALAPGDRARVERVEGLTLHVRREA